MVTSPRLKWLALALLAAVQFMVVLDIAIVNVALPSIQADLGFSQANLQWVISAYALVFGGFLLLGGRAADLLGRRRIFMVGLVVFTIGSLLCGLAWSEASLIGARAIQGLGAATISPAALAILMTTFAEGRRAQHRARRLGRGRRLRRRRGRPARRRPHRRSLVGVDLLRQHPGRASRRSRSLPCCSARAATRACSSFDAPGAVLVTGGLTTLVLAITQGNELGLELGRDDRRLRRRGGAARRLRASGRTAPRSR